MIGLIDCDNFFVSCEQALRPNLKKSPVLVLSNNDGCVISRSNEAKALGIPMGIPAFKIKDKICQEGIFVFSSHYNLYKETSEQIIRILRNNSPCVEIYSIDEAFLDLSGMSYLKEYGLHLVQLINKEMDIPVSVGIAPTKTLAKVGSYFAKKYKKYQHVCVIDSHEKRIRALQLTPITEVWGIGKHLSMKLKAQGVSTAYDFVRLPRRFIRQLTTITGERVWLELNGESCYEFCVHNVEKRQISSSHSFEHMVTDLETLSKFIAEHARICAQKLRAQRSCVKLMRIYVCTNKFRLDLPQCHTEETVSFPIATSDTLDIVEQAIACLKRLYRDRYHYKKIGVILLQVIPESYMQSDLFDTKDWNKSKRLMLAMDEINEKYSNKALVPAVEYLSKKE